MRTTKKSIITYTDYYICFITGFFGVDNNNCYGLLIWLICVRYRQLSKFINFILLTHSSRLLAFGRCNIIFLFCLVLIIVLTVVLTPKHRKTSFELKYFFIFMLT